LEDAENKKIVAAQSILIIGGGPVGVELAGEIVVDYPDKKVRIQ
jgi:NADH dehydrogenase FAD-containing subunit